MKPGHERYIRSLENLNAENVTALAPLLAEDVRFRDPFNDVKGVEAMLKIFRHLFENVEDVAFDVLHAISREEILMMEWRFQGRLRGMPWVFDGMSLVRFSQDGRVVEHFDYWDSGEHFFQRLPVIGLAITWLRAKLAVR
jgi:steroid delta-isomerase